VEFVTRAQHRFARISPSKVRPVARLIRGKTVGEALELLSVLPHRSARFLEKVLRSARANAEEQGHPDTDLLIVRVRVDDGPRLKRIQPRARGMAFLILKRMSHITVELGRWKAEA
jgi:large subunit ribosomal protein L22